MMAALCAAPISMDCSKLYGHALSAGNCSMTCHGNSSSSCGTGGEKRMHTRSPGSRRDFRSCPPFIDPSFWHTREDKICEDFELVWEVRAVRDVACTPSDNTIQWGRTLRASIVLELGADPSECRLPTQPRRESVGITTLSTL